MNMLDIETKKAIAKHLFLLGTGKIKPLNKEAGVCAELRNVFNHNGTAFVANYAKSWSKYSGVFLYPIAHSRKSVRDAFWGIVNLWDNTPYGDNRRELCLHIAAKLQEEIDSNAR